MALEIFLEQVASLFQKYPRGQARNEPGLSSSPFQATSKSMMVLLVPSLMSPNRTYAGRGVGLEGWTVGINGNMPSAAKPPWPLVGPLTLYCVVVPGIVPSGPMQPT